MNAGVLLFVIGDAKDYLVGKGALRTDGTLVLNDVNEDIGLAASVEASLKEHGVDIPDQVDKVVKAIPLVLSVIGVS